MSWQEEYQKAMKAAVFRRGLPVGEDGGSYYGYIADDWKELCAHLKSCEPVFGQLTEATWEEFMDTFYEGDETQHGVDLVVSCSCGEIVARTWRWRGSIGDMLHELLREED